MSTCYDKTGLTPDEAVGEVVRLRELVAKLTTALERIIYPDNEREIRFDSKREYYVADIEGGELANARAAIARAKGGA